MLVVFVFFKQKTAYEMRISDWSSDVCSSDLLAEHTYDITEYVVDIAKKEGLADGLGSLEGGVALHMACHARAQNVGAKAAEMLRLLPQADVKVIERCSGHGGSWGVLKQHFETAIKVGRPAARQAARSEEHTSELQSLMRISYAVFC